MGRSGIVSDSTRDYRAYGLHIRSAVPLPFAPSSESGEIEPDVAGWAGRLPPNESGRCSYRPRKWTGCMAPRRSASVCFIYPVSLPT